jgi:general secretion pathway protein G
MNTQTPAAAGRPAAPCKGRTRAMPPSVSAVPVSKPSRRVLRHRFTLFEIMIVIVIIGLVFGLVGPSLLGKLKRSKPKIAKMQVEMLAEACRDYFLDMQDFPGKLDDLVQSPGDKKWQGPYLEKSIIPLDPWGEPYQYEKPGQHGDFDIFSYGSDKAPGGDKDAADVNSWE